MVNIVDGYVGTIDEVSYGTGIAVTKFHEFISEGVVGKYERIESEGLRSGNKVLRSDRFMPNPKGAEGDLKLEVLDAGFGFWLKHMLGAVNTTGATDPYSHAATVGSLTGKSFTMQVGRVANDGTLHPFTYEGGKVKSWELSNQVDGVLQCSLDLDFKSEKIGTGAGAYAAATPTYPASAKLLTFAGGVVQIGGTDFAVSDASFKGDNGLKTDRWFLGGTKKEPLEEALREYTFDLKGEFDGLTHLNRISSLTAAGAVAALSLKWVAGTHELNLTATAARLDEGLPTNDGGKVLESNISGKVLFDGTTSAVTLTYKTADATP